MNKRVMSILMSLAIMLSLIPAMPAQAAGINIGDYVVMGKYYDEPVLWRCVDIDENGPLMLSDKIISIKPFDAAHPNDSYFERSIYGSNLWENSNMRSWLNSEASEGNIEWLCGNPPAEDKVNDGYNDYAGEKGFLADGNFTAGERNAVKPVTQKSILSEQDMKMAEGGTEIHKYNADISSVVQNYDNVYYHNVTDRVFLFDVKQVNRVYQNSDILGTDYYIGKPTAKAVENSEYEDSNLSESNYWGYWLRNPDPGYMSSPASLRCIDPDGFVALDIRLAGDAMNPELVDKHTGVRPALYLVSSISFKSGSGTLEAPYIIDTDSASDSGQTLDDPQQPAADKPADWAEKEVNEAIDLGLIPQKMQNGYADNITRQDFCNLVINLISIKTGKTIDSVISEKSLDLNLNSFTDTADKAVIAANKLGIVNGKSGGIFDPDGGITRQEAAVMLANSAKALGVNTDSNASGFSDESDIDTWAKNSVNYVSSKSIMNGVGGNNFDPHGSYTRQQAFMTILRLYGNIQ